MQKRLEWSVRAHDDLERIISYYTDFVSIAVARSAREFILGAVEKLGTLPVIHRPGKSGTRECVIKRFPYTIIYRATGDRIRVVRILHQARKYFS